MPDIVGSSASRSHRLRSKILRRAFFNGLLGCSLLVTGILMLFLALRLVLNLYGSTATILATTHIVVGIPHLLFAWGATGGKSWCLIGAMILSPIVGALSLFALLTMSPAGLVGITLAILNIVLCIMNLGNVSKIHAAKCEMKRVNDLEPASPWCPGSERLRKSL